MAAWHPQSWWRAWRVRRAALARRTDPADMGTVFGLEACLDEPHRPIDAPGSSAFANTQAHAMPVAERLKGRSVW